MIKAIPVASLLSINTANMNYQLESYMVSLISDQNLPITLHLLNLTNPGNLLGILILIFKLFFSYFKL